ncbi:hypothetical protein JHN49_35105, partial [Streptomyces sp. MBT57]|nr:hypothetical protein [Streptomyces sp. MBT57]
MPEPQAPDDTREALAAIASLLAPATSGCAGARSEAIAARASRVSSGACGSGMAVLSFCGRRLDGPA